MDLFGHQRPSWILRWLGNDYWQIRNDNSGQCLGVGGASTAEGAHVIQWPCADIPDQRWYGRRNGGTYEFVNQNSGKCMAVGGSGMADGAPVIQWKCLNTPDQKWY
ncbi:RICIN domain-containing protein [Actinoplanes teichomyceticus]|uniref:RICIN domain-containing protein n=1 Tax=Actinoplanes teichomyceticus TaxID=1867 RepID=UPI0013DDA6FD